MASAFPVCVDAGLPPESRPALADACAFAATRTASANSTASACPACVDADWLREKPPASAYPARVDVELETATLLAQPACARDDVAFFAARVSASAFSPPALCAWCGRVES